MAQGTGLVILPIVTRLPYSEHCIYHFHAPRTAVTTHYYNRIQLKLVSGPSKYCLFVYLGKKRYVVVKYDNLVTLILLCVQRHQSADSTRTTTPSCHATQHSTHCLAMSSVRIVRLFHPSHPLFSKVNNEIMWAIFYTCFFEVDGTEEGLDSIRAILKVPV